MENTTISPEPTMGSILKTRADAYRVSRNVAMDDRIIAIISYIKHAIDGDNDFIIAHGPYRTLMDAADHGCNKVDVHWSHLKKLTSEENILVFKGVMKIIKDVMPKYNGVTITSSVSNNRMCVVFSW